MIRGGRRSRGDEGFYPPPRGPPPTMFPPRPPPPGWHRPPFPGGPPGYPDPDFMHEPMGFRPMLGPDYGPMDEPDFGSEDREFGPPARFHGPRPPMMDPDFGPIPDLGHGAMMVRDYEHLDPRDLGPLPDRLMMPEPPEFDAFGPPFDDGDFRRMERECPPRGVRPMPDELFHLDRDYMPTMDERCRGPPPIPAEGGPDPYFGPRGYPPPPDLDLGPPGWVEPPVLPPPPLGPPLDGPMNPIMPGIPPPDLVPSAPKKPKLPPKHCSKPPPGRFQGIISFVGPDFGYIEQEDMTKIHFSFNAFWGDKGDMIPGVRVQYTIYKDKEQGKDCATDVVVPPGGTEEVDGEILQGVVTQAPECLADAKTRKLTLAKFAGRISATLSDEEKADLSFTTHDYRPTLLLGDRVQFNLLTNLVSKKRRATNIALTPNTFEFTNETRDTGVVMNMKDGSGSVMSEEWSNLNFDADENLSESELRVMDEVEFTVISVRGKEQQKAIRVKKLPEGTVTFGKKTREKIAEAMEKNATRFSLEKGKWKAVTSEALPQRTVVFEDTSSEQYEGTILTPLPRASDRVQEKPEALAGLLSFSVAGAERHLPFGPGDVTSEATMMPGDRVQFNICTKRSTKADRATNIEILPDDLDHSQEQRETGIVMDLRESFGFIQCPRDPQLFFHIKEVVAETSLSIMDKVEFSVIPASAGEGQQAVRVKKVLWNAFIATPKLEGLGAPSKEKKKMTIKLLRDSVNEEMKNLKVKIESYSPESETDEETAELMNEFNSSGVPGEDSFIPPESEFQPVQMDVDGESMEFLGPENNSVSVGTTQQKKEIEEGSSGRNGVSEDSGRAVRAGKHQSPPREHARRRSRSSERCYRSERRHRRSRSRSHSRERGVRSSRRRSRSRSREREDSYSRKHSSSRDSSSRSRRRTRSRSPGRDGSNRKRVEPLDKNRTSEAVQKPAPSPVSPVKLRPEIALDAELLRKKKELELLEERIARKRAIMAMEQKGLAPRGLSKDEEDPESALFRRPREPESAPKPAPLPSPVKSILKKRTESVIDYGHQSEIPRKPAPKSNTAPRSFSESPSEDHPSSHHTSDERPHGTHSPDRVPRKPSISRHEPVRYPLPTQSSVPQPPVTRPPVCYSPPLQEKPAKSTASTQFDRFLRTLNKGVDVKLLTSLVKEARNEALAKQAAESPVPTQDEALHNDRAQRKDSFGKTTFEDSRGGTTYEDARGSTKHEDLLGSTRCDDSLGSAKYADMPGLSTEETDDFLLPHERAFLDGSGFSRILGMKYDPEEEEEKWKEGDVEDEERFLYGDKADEEESGTAMVEADKSQWGLGHGEEPRKREEPKPVEDKMPSYDKIQSLLQTIGLELDVSEVSKLTDRTKERLYGKKPRTKPFGHADSESRRDSCSSGRQRSQTGSPDSDRTRSISPVRTSNREVYMSPPDALEPSSLHDKEKLAAIVRMVRNLQKARSPSGSAPSTSTEYAHAPQGAQASVHDYAHGQHANATVTSWNPVPSQPEVQSPPAYSQQLAPYVHPPHSESYTTPQHTASYLALPPPPSAYVSAPMGPAAVSPFLPPQSYAPAPVGLPPGLPSAYAAPPSMPMTPFLQQQPPIFTGAPSCYPLHPLTGVPIMPFGSTNFLTPPLVTGAGEVQKQTVVTKSRCLREIKTVSTPGKKGTKVTNLKEVTMTGLQSSGSSRPPSSAPSKLAETKQVTTTTIMTTTITEDDIRAKQKKRLEQFNERMREKKRQKKEAMKSGAESQKIPPGKTCTEVKNVWVCGHSLVFWAEKRAKSPEYGMQLGMDPSRVRVWWKGLQGMTWDQLLPLLLKLKGSWPNPDVIILHLGGNDLGKTDTKVLLESVKKDLASLRGIFPSCLPVWSDILPRRSWPSTEDSTAIETIRIAVNKKVHADITELGGAVVAHDSIRPGSDVGLYRPDGVHLSGKGIDMFNIDLQDFLEKWEVEEGDGANQS
ncbi:hypothetical protein GJAV_G00242540 [Gymnothorax javanicus]|nr:hypothetical protein GJAV_G00242540 [Gymnothorax javanicus]